MCDTFETRDEADRKIAEFPSQEAAEATLKPGHSIYRVVTLYAEGKVAYRYKFPV